MSPGENVWPRIAQLATALDGGRTLSENMLDRLEAELRSAPRHARDEIRRQMILLVAALSRLEVRLIEAHGPLPTAV